ncbi:MAG: polysaccharide deacetylase family protein [Rhodospirillales bacterium]|jgi:peptidoglycan/xylan/chitin deacetylase (PgdA/CDA1 family)|nr:polysaccharide deacetylase family protein [Rhodospirillales bacterium]
MAFSEIATKARLRRMVARVCAHSGQAWAWRHLAPKPSVRVLAYHGIEPSPTSHFSVSVDNFERQMALLSARYAVTTTDELADALEAGQLPPRPSIVVTFDDGFRDFLTHAVPVLAKYRVPATCFVIAGKLDAGDPRFLDRHGVLEALDTGLVTIGCHSMTHRSIRQTPLGERIVEVRDAKSSLEHAIGRPVDHFCYPYGTRNDFDDACAKLIKDSGYRLALTSINGLNGQRTHRYKLRRTKIEAGDDIRTFERILGGALDIWYVADMLLFALQRRRRVQFR